MQELELPESGVSEAALITKPTPSLTNLIELNVIEVPVEDTMPLIVSSSVPFVSSSVPVDVKVTRIFEAAPVTITEK